MQQHKLTEQKFRYYNEYKNSYEYFLLSDIRVANYMQHVGLVDETGKDIYTGDMIKLIYEGEEKTGLVCVCNFSFGIIIDETKIFYSFFEILKKLDRLQIVGSIDTVEINDVPEYIKRRKV